MVDTTELNPFTATALDARHEVFARLAAIGPLHRIALPSGQPAWLVTSYADARAALGDPRLIKAPSPTDALLRKLRPDLSPSVHSHMLTKEGEDHVRLRRLVSAAFTRRRIENLIPRIVQIADDLLDALTDPCDLIADFAFPLPMTVICDLFGVPREAQKDLGHWTAVATAGAYYPPEEFCAAVESVVKFVHALIAERRADPRDDLLTDLIAARDGDERLSEDELCSMMAVMIVAGHETTTNLIANGAVMLLTHPEQLERIQADHALIASAVEEMLRFDGAILVGFPLLVTEAVKIAGTAMTAGEIVVPALLAANRDRARFEAPEQFDVARDPNHHLGFGHGVHFCLGAHLARVETRIAFERLFDRYPKLALAVPAEKLARRPHYLFHQLAELPLTLG